MELAKQTAPVIAIACDPLPHRLSGIPDQRATLRKLSITFKKNLLTLVTAETAAQLIDVTSKEFPSTCSISTKFDSCLMSSTSGD